MTAVVDVPRIAVLAGPELARRVLLAQLQRPDLQRVTVIVFRYHDFNLLGPGSRRGSPTDLIRLLSRAAEAGRNVTFLTRDPLAEGPPAAEFSASAQRDWHSGLSVLHRSGVDVKLHPSVHAKVYLFESNGGARFCYAVGSSNLTQPGMYRWAECNVQGYHDADYLAVQKRVSVILSDKGTISYEDWLRQLRRTRPDSPMLS